jgi:hypothetical protein
VLVGNADSQNVEIYSENSKSIGCERVRGRFDAITF